MVLDGASRRFPRIRGDEPDLTAAAQTYAEFSPHTRG